MFSDSIIPNISLNSFFINGIISYLQIFLFSSNKVLAVFVRLFILGNTILKVQSYELNKTYFYTYEKCFKDNCNAYDDAITVPFTASRHNNYILTLHINYTPDGDMLYSKSNTLPRRFANDFMTIQYKVDDKVYSNNSINVTPDYQKDFIAFEVGGEIVDASVIQAIVTIRNQKYIINLKMGH